MKKKYFFGFYEIGVLMFDDYKDVKQGIFATHPSSPNKRVLPFRELYRDMRDISEMEDKVLQKLYFETPLQAWKKYYNAKELSEGLLSHYKVNPNKEYKFEVNIPLQKKKTLLENYQKME